MHDQDDALLRKWAEIFRAEGDAETADGIERQLQVDSERELSDEEASQVRGLAAQARKFDHRGAYEDAADCFAQALRIVEQGLGVSHPDAWDLMCNVARCRLNDGQYAAALQDYMRLARFAESHHGRNDARTRVCRQYVRHCHDFLRQDAGSMRLQPFVDSMVRRAVAARAMDATGRAARMRDIGLRLAMRGKQTLAVRFHEKAIALHLSHAQPDDSEALREIHQYALDLRDAGSSQRAAHTLRLLIGRRHRVSETSEQRAQICATLRDLAACLTLQGCPHSAQESLALAKKLDRDTPVGDGPSE